MSMHIQPRGDDKVDITIRNQEIKGVITYGKKVGAIAKFMGIASKIKGDDNKSYYVNIRSLGKHWKMENSETNPLLSAVPGLSTDSHEGFASKTLKSIEKYFQIRKEKHDYGESFIHNYNPLNDPTTPDADKSIVSIIDKKIKTFLENHESSKDEIKTILSELKMDKSNLDKVIKQLESKIKSIDGNFDKNATTPIFDKKLNEFGKLQLRQIFLNKLEPNAPQVANNVSLINKPNIFEVSIFNISYALTSYSTSLATTGINSNYNFAITTLAKEISELRYDQSNLDAVFNQLMDKLIASPSSTGLIDTLEGFKKDSSSNDKLQFIELFKNMIDPKYIKDALFIDNLREIAPQLVPQNGNDSLQKSHDLISKYVDKFESRSITGSPEVISRINSLINAIDKPLDEKFELVKKELLQKLVLDRRNLDYIQTSEEKQQFLEIIMHRMNDFLNRLDKKENPHLANLAIDSDFITKDGLPEKPLNIDIKR